MMSTDTSEHPILDGSMTASAGTTEAVVLDAAAPGWFTRRKARSSLPDGKRRRRIVVVAEDEDEQLTVMERFRRWLASFSAKGLVGSFLVHSLLAILLIVLSILFHWDIPGIRGNDAFSTLLSESDSEQVVLDDAIDTQLKDAGGDQQPVELPQFRVVQTTTQSPRTDAAVDLDQALASAMGQGEGSTDKSGDGGGARFAVPEKGRAVTKGSFSVWTIPADPVPRQDYRIVIEVKLPSRIHRYRASDLSGLVVGTDLFRMAIPWDRHWPNRTVRQGSHGRFIRVRKGKGSYLPVKKRRAQLMILVPGAKALVKDTIRIRSKILKEQQTLHIVF